MTGLYICENLPAQHLSSISNHVASSHSFMTTGPVTTYTDLTKHCSVHTSTVEKPTIKRQSRNCPGVSESSPGFYCTHLTPSSKSPVQPGSNVVQSRLSNSSRNV